jgi:hypothetical protein
LQFIGLYTDTIAQDQEDIIMIDSGKIRAWATPLTIGAFALSAITGVMIFFHVQLGLAKVLHEWFSWCLVIGGLFHVIGSWQPFVRYFSKPAGMTIIGLFAALIVVSFLPLGSSDGHGKGMPSDRLAGLLAHASFATVANSASHKPEELMKEFESKGVVVEGKEETIQGIAARNGKQTAEILNMIF